MDITNLIISALCGAAGANFAGLAFRKFGLGYIRNTIVGVIGGLLVSFAELIKFNPVLSSVIWGGIAGAVLVLIIGSIRNAVKKP